MSGERWREVTKADPCPACGKPDWCAWTPEGDMLKCERTREAPPGMVKVKDADGGALFRYADASVTRPPASPAPKARKARAIYKTPEDAIAAALAQVQHKVRRDGQDPDAVHFTDSWSYPKDAMRTLRFDWPGDKDYRPIHRNGTGWSIGDPVGLLPLYRGDTIDAAGPVVIVEGEKCADAAASVGLVVVTSAHGGGSAHKSDWSALAGREIIIMPDNDATGRKYAQEVATILNELMPAAAVKIVELPGLGDGGDIADWIAPDGPMGDKLPDEIKGAVLDMAKATKLWALPPAKSLEGEPVITCLADVVPVPVKWFWPSRIALGKLTLIVGDPGLGKSFITLDMAGRASRGAAWPDCSAMRNTPGGVVLLSAEDDLADTIRPRLDAAGADVLRVNALTTIKRFAPALGKDVFEPFNLTAHLPALELAIKQMGDCRLVIIDPVSAFMGKADSHKNTEVRGLLAPLSDLAARHGVAVIAVSHLRKGEGPAMYRAMGSLAFIAAARAAYCVTKDKDDPTGQRRFFLPVKNNLGNDRDGLAYCLDDTSTANSQPVVKWEATPISISADDALSEDDGRHGEDDTSEIEEAKTWLADVLMAGPVTAKEIYAKAKDDGIAKRTLDRAKLAMRVTTAKAKGVANGPWSWGLGETCRQERHGPGQENLGDVGNLGNLPEKPKENGVSEGSTIEGCQYVEDCQPAPAAATTPAPERDNVHLDPDRPGPIDLLTPEQRKKYKAIYLTRPAGMSASERHARAWRAALKPC